MTNYCYYYYYYLEAYEGEPFKLLKAKNGIFHWPLALPVA